MSRSFKATITAKKSKRFVRSCGAKGRNQRKGKFCCDSNEDIQDSNTTGKDSDRSKRNCVAKGRDRRKGKFYRHSYENIQDSTEWFLTEIS